MKQLTLISINKCYIFKSNNLMSAAEKCSQTPDIYSSSVFAFLYKGIGFVSPFHRLSPTLHERMEGVEFKVWMTKAAFCFSFSFFLSHSFKSRIKASSFFVGIRVQRMMSLVRKPKSAFSMSFNCLAK